MRSFLICSVIGALASPAAAFQMEPPRKDDAEATASVSLPEAEPCWLIEEALFRSVRVDPRVEAAKAERDLAAANFQASLSQSLPQVSTFAQFGESSNGLLQNNQSDNEFGLIVQQNLFDFGATRLGQIGAKAQMSATEHNIDQVKGDVAQEIGTAYLELLRSGDILQLAKEQEDYFARDALTVDDRLKAKAITITDASQIKANYALAVSQTIDATQGRDQAQARLEILLDQEVSCADRNDTARYFNETEALLDEETLDSLLDLSASNAAALRESRERIRAARATSEQSRRAGLPTVAFSGFISYEEADNNPFTQQSNDLEEQNRVGINITGPLYSGGLNQARQNDARARLRGANSDLASIRSALRDTVTRAWVRAQGQKNSQAALMDARENLATQLENIQREYEIGTRTLREVVDTAEAYYATASQEVNLRYQYYNNMLILRSTAYGLDLPGGR